MLAATRRTTAASQTTAVTSQEPAGLLIYDGDCGFCTAAARWFADRCHASAAIAPWQSVELHDYGLTEADVSTAAYWVAADGTTWRGSAGMTRAVRQCGPMWNVLGLIGSTPPTSWLLRPMYRVLAHFRYRLPGSTDACRI